MGGQGSRASAQPAAQTTSPAVVAVRSGQAASGAVGEQKPPSFASWVLTRSTLRSMLAEWAKSTTDQARRERLTEIAVMTVPPEFAIFALCEPSLLQGGPGLYMKAPREEDPDLIVILHAVDKESSVLHHVGVRPDVSPFVAQGVFSSWARSIPKRFVVESPETTLQVFGLQPP
mmetsp:Transcript_35928/g.65965  ORF Transcript_35928/g.65965 Transcript_35928/m.65965 type:complete len:174 (-) Transcript_35928:50-571(-)